MKDFKRFRELIAWQKARRLTYLIYGSCRQRNFSKDHDLRSQIQRAAISIMSNIAEGYGRGTPRQFMHFLDISRGSAAEVQSLLFVAFDQGYISEIQFESLQNLADECIALIAGLKKSLSKKL